MDHLVLLVSRGRHDGADGAKGRNTTCEIPAPYTPSPTTPVAGRYDFYHLNVIVSGACAAFSTVVILLLMWQHATHMSKPKEQMHILRIAWFIPVYAIGIWIMILEPRVYVYLLSFIVIYEAYALAYFYLLLCEILAEPADAALGERAVLLSPLIAHARRKGVSVTNANGFFSPHWRFRRHFVEAFQCPPLMVLLMVAGVTTQATGTYCLTAHDAVHAHLYLVVVQIVSMVAAIIGVVHTYVPLRRELKEHRALSKLWAFKLLIFLQVAQGLAFSILDGISPPSIENSDVFSPIDIIVGIPLLIVSCELVFFAIFFHYAYSVAPYQLSDEQLRSGQRYAMHCWRVWWDILKIHDLIAATKFMFRLGEEIRLLERDMQMQERQSWSPAKAKEESGHEVGVVVGWVEAVR
ncbi:Uu.00g026550.m01.CDS01 [Anthostomella pinea]|uniref:Uu.00g026550.m01.CDS01 n=1 Tax=Anthostomella pinea TaxID=933095 RepID=A0AAI8YCL7_9PEZI|nr:Uu.00g026550.m01.CDS01 [Anthostomella pinea]